MSNRDPKTDFVMLNSFAKEMYLLGEGSVHDTRKLNEEDNFGFMLACFAPKQMEHIRSLGLLTDENQFADATMIARSMLEGQILASWTSLDPQPRALLWRGYSAVVDFRTLCRLQDEGKPVDADRRNCTMQGMQIYGLQYVTPKARKKRSPLGPNDYLWKWHVTPEGHVVKMREMVNEIGDQQLRQLYSLLSEWVHWGPEGIGKRLSRSEHGVSININAIELAAMAILSGIVAMGRVLDLYSQHFGLELLASQLSEFRARLNKAFDIDATSGRLPT